MGSESAFAFRPGLPQTQRSCPDPPLTTGPVRGEGSVRRGGECVRRECEEGRGVCEEGV